MRKFAALLLVAALAIGCGGGGGGGGGTTTSATIVGRILDVQTGGPPAPQASVAIPSGASTLTALADGSFTLGAKTGTNQLVVSETTYPSYTFTTAPASNTSDVGDLWIGPEKVTLQGRVVDSSTFNPVGSAIIRFGGVQGASVSDGTFALTNVAYSSTNQAAFWGIVGTITAANYYDQTFTTSPSVAASGVVDVGDILVTPSSNTTPPGPPFDISGRVLPIGSSAGTVVTLMQGVTAIRSFNVAADGNYTFWVGPGSYTVTFAKAPSLTAPTQNAVVVSQNTVVHVPDVTLQ